MDLNDMIEFFRENGATVINLDDVFGDRVICDVCGEEYTNKPDVGGILVGSKAICPKCAPEYEEGLKQYDESHLVRARCPSCVSFADWVLKVLR